MQVEKFLKNNESFGQMVWGPGYEAFEMLDNSMSDGTRRGLELGDILRCREIAEWDSLRDLSKLKYPVVIVASGRALVGIIQQQNGGTVLLSKYNPDYKNKLIDLAKVRIIYQVESFQRDMTPKAASRNKTRTNILKLKYDASRTRTRRIIKRNAKR